MVTLRKKSEIADARQFTGGKDCAMDLTLWVQSNGGRAFWIDTFKDLPETIRLTTSTGPVPVFVDDWIIWKQDGSFVSMSPQQVAYEYDVV